MERMLIFDEDDRILRLPSELRAALGLQDRVGTLEWQELVVEDSSRFKPAEGEDPVSLRAYLKRAGGEIWEATLRCERLAGTSGIYLAEVALADAPGSDGKAAAGETDSLEFLTTVSHELRVSLNGVIGFANVLGNTELNAEQLGILEKLQSCNQMLKGLINDILEYSRVATSRIDLKAESVVLETFVSDVVGLFRERARKKGLDLIFDADGSSGRKVSLSKLRVTQVLSNLVTNAIKFTEAGWVKVSVSCDETWICINVQDTGPGIAESERESVFRPFVQAGRGLDAAEGSGLGLAISKELVEKMGGRIELSHPESGGSCFEIRLPLVSQLPLGASDDAPASSLEGDGRSEPAARPKRDGKKKRILVVEDNRLNADILGHFLQDYGVFFDHAENGREALERYEDGRYDLILMDVMLPEMNGYEATQKILARSRRNPPVPIIGVTAKVFRRDQLRCLEAGMVEVVHKPVDFKQLREVLDLYLYSKDYGQGGFGPSVESGPKEDAGVSSPAVEREPTKPLPSAASGLDPRILEDYINRMKTPDTSRGEIVETAMGIVDGEVERLLGLLNEGEREEIGMRAHSLKGALALLGARNLLDLAKGLELLAGEDSKTLRREHWRSLIETAYQGFKEELDEYLQTSLTK